MNAQSPCLWCRAPKYRADLEHVVPEALGCPPWLVLEDGVCKACNNGLGHVDQALVRQFEMAAFIGGVPRKKGRKPSVDGWASLATRHGADGPEVHFNAGPGDWTVGARRVKPASAATGVLDHSFTPDGMMTTVSFGLAFGEDPKLARALYKLGLGLLAAREGLPVALDARYDAVRRFVRQGEGDFRYLAIPGDDPHGHAFWPFWRGPNGEGPLIPIRLFGVEITLDLDAGQRCLARLQTELSNQEELAWRRLPDRPASRGRARRARSAEPA